MPDPDRRPVDPDVDLHVPEQRVELAAAPGAVLAVISAGGALGALARYGVGLAVPTVPGRFPLGTFLVNVTGCLLIGVLMVLITELRRAHRLVRPFLGVGVLGGFTTFSTYAEEVRGLLRPESIGTGLGYLAGTVLAALAAVWAGSGVTRLVAS
ncbi:MAG TPA: fluoride efflux transporter CrcB [Actinophytocola sp.]|uniref:fluoride efflux transporter CrcB n=1 Tax=Actinophytocola sp. TaxID=1872138 RepID=UPI002DB5CDA8|nr:fluoride efflux transporter CrcB [Actinophytocola sp.]HEU5471383.1 fluoride efflux transporter CrcB [Actinophytocola sp.]